MFTVDAILHQYYPRLSSRPLITTPLRTLLRRLLHEAQFIRFAEEYPHLKGMDFVEQVLETFQCTTTVADRDRENIPASGRVMIVAKRKSGRRMVGASGAVPLSGVSRRFGKFPSPNGWRICRARNWKRLPEQPLPVGGCPSPSPPK